MQSADLSVSPCGNWPLELETQIHQKFVEMEINNLGDELQAITWRFFKTSDGKFITVRQSYVAVPHGEITDELVASAECDSPSAVNEKIYSVVT